MSPSQRNANGNSNNRDAITAPKIQRGESSRLPWPVTATWRMIWQFPASKRSAQPCSPGRRVEKCPLSIVCNKCPSAGVDKLWGTLNNEIPQGSENGDRAAGPGAKGSVKMFLIPEALFFGEIRTGFCSYLFGRGSSLKL